MRKNGRPTRLAHDKLVIVLLCVFSPKSFWLIFVKNWVFYTWQMYSPRALEIIVVFSFCSTSALRMFDVIWIYERAVCRHLVAEERKRILNLHSRQTGCNTKYFLWKKSKKFPGGSLIQKVCSTELNGTEVFLFLELFCIPAIKKKRRKCLISCSVLINKYVSYASPFYELLITI